MMKSHHTHPYLDPRSHPDAKPGFVRERATRSSRGASQRGRFVTQSHVLSAPLARPGSLAIAAAVAVALVLVTRKLTH